MWFRMSVAGISPRANGIYLVFRLPMDMMPSAGWRDQSWCNGKIVTTGCSSTAEWQMAVAAMDHPAHAAMIPAVMEPG